MPPGPGMPAGVPAAPPAIAVALRAWVPQEYASHLAAQGLRVVAAGGDLTVDQARQWGAQVLVLSAECVGSHSYLLTAPPLPTVFVTPQRVMVPDAPGFVQVLEPLRASEVAAAAREAISSFVR